MYFKTQKETWLLLLKLTRTIHSCLEVPHRAPDKISFNYKQAVALHYHFSCLMLHCRAVTQAASSILESCGLILTGLDNFSVWTQVNMEVTVCRDKRIMHGVLVQINVAPTRFAALLFLFCLVFQKSWKILSHCVWILILIIIITTAMTDFMVRQPEPGPVYSSRLWQELCT